MEWASLIDDRVQTTTWDMDQVVDKSVVEEIMDEVHRRSASKQNVVRYEINIFDWSDTEFINHFNNFCQRDPRTPNAQYNTQVLAPYLLVFTRRKDAPWNREGDPSHTIDLQTQVYNRHMITAMEIGIASTNIMLSAKTKGLDSGFCNCMDWEYEHLDKIKEKLNIDDMKDLYVAVGLGVGSTSTRKTYNPHTKEMNMSYTDVGNMWKNEPKPEKQKYIKFA